jgi:hypothetical protein
VFSCSPGTRGQGSCFVLQINGGASAATGNAPRIILDAATGNPLPGTNQFNCKQTSSANPATLDAAACGSLTQTNTTGDNLAPIVQKTTQQSAGAVSQSASETAGSSSSTPFSQTNTSGNNVITITQTSSQSSSDTPAAAQTAYASQVNGSGQNQATVGQNELQQVSDAALTQDQEGTQVACVTQDSASGPNLATVNQVMNQSEADSASGISQFQNRNPGPFSSCGSASTSINPNLAALVLQNKNTPGATGQNKQTVKQSLFQMEHSSTTSGAVNQQQGPNFDQGGLEAIPDQTSTGLSTLTVPQGEQQHMQASTKGALIQTQNDPVRQPDCSGNDCSQGSNPGDTFALTQTGVQQASPFSPQSQQLFDIEGDCTTSGDCNIQSTDTSNHVNNGVPTSQSQSCTGSSEVSCTTSTFVANTGE